MKRVSFFLFTIILFFASCTPKATPDTTTTTTDTTPTSTAATSPSYNTVVIKDGIPSPQKEMQATIGDTKIAVVYGSPSVKGRTVWGDLVPFDKVWRVGANEATTFETSTALKIQGKELAAGKYGLFAIPTEKGKWTVIFNSVHEQWGAYKYDDSKDVLRVNATAKELKGNVEAMEFIMEGNNLIFQWEKLAVSVEIGM
jgi:hypothetical protein